MEPFYVLFFFQTFPINSSCLGESCDAVFCCRSYRKCFVDTRLSIDMGVSRHEMMTAFFTFWVNLSFKLVKTKALIRFLSTGVAWRWQMMMSQPDSANLRRLVSYCYSLLSCTSLSTKQRWHTCGNTEALLRFPWQPHTHCLYREGVWPRLICSLAAECLLSPFEGHGRRVTSVLYIITFSHQQSADKSAYLQSANRARKQ